MLVIIHMSSIMVSFFYYVTSILGFDSHPSQFRFVRLLSGLLSKFGFFLVFFTIGIFTKGQDGQDFVCVESASENAHCNQKYCHILFRKRFSAVQIMPIIANVISNISTACTPLVKFIGTPGNFHPGHPVND